MSTVGPLVLLVEDEPQVRRFLRATLTVHGYRLIEAVSVLDGKQLATSHNQILREVWGPNATEAHYVRVHMAELRKKIEADPARPRILVTEMGVGYRLRDRLDEG